MAKSYLFCAVNRFWTCFGSFQYSLGVMSLKLLLPPHGSLRPARVGFLGRDLCRHRGLSWTPYILHYHDSYNFGTQIFKKSLIREYIPYIYIEPRFRAYSLITDFESSGYMRSCSISVNNRRMAGQLCTQHFSSEPWSVVVASSQYTLMSC